MNSDTYPVPLCIQLAAPPSLDAPEFSAVLAQLKEAGYYGIELNMPEFSDRYADQLMELLDRHDLRLTMIASGAYANRHGLSLSSPDEDVRKRSVAALEEMLDCAAKFGAGVICGFIKGGPSGAKEEAARRLRASLEELDRTGKTAAAPLYLEATNHYEALSVNTLAEGEALTRNLAHPVYVLPDTYHMNIEETSMAGALARFLPYFHNLHISDNNRHFPGIGRIDFAELFRLLLGLGYDGTVTIEGNVYRSLAEDIAFSSRYLAGIRRQLDYTGLMR